MEDAYRTRVPLDFFLQPASSSGKYHPKNGLGVGGLVRHIKAAMMMAKDLFPLYHFSPTDEDYIMCGLALHDIAKPGKLHPVESKLTLEPMMDEYYPELMSIIPLIESHMGQWNQ